MMISNSEVNTFHQCERRHFYSFRQALKLDGHSKALTRGIVGHEALEVYYKAKQRGMPKAQCLGSALNIVDRAIVTYPDFTKELTQLKQVLMRYVDHYWNEPWKVVEVESQHSLFLENSIEYGMRLDLLVEVLAGRDKGQIVIVDHKFVYDFFTDREKKVNTQFPKYIATLRKNGIPVRKAILNQIRYRELKSPTPDALFRRDTLTFSDTEIENHLGEFQKVAQRIQAYNELTEEEHLEQSTMYLDKMSCGKCAYQPLCSLRIQGLDDTRTRKVLYQHNDYVDGYKEVI